jgi:hypothetical protein
VNLPIPAGLEEALHRIRLPVFSRSAERRTVSVRPFPGGVEACSAQGTPANMTYKSRQTQEARRRGLFCPAFDNF